MLLGQVTVEFPRQRFAFEFLEITVCQRFILNSNQETLQIAVEVKIVVNAVVATQSLLRHNRFKHIFAPTVKAFREKEDFIGFAGSTIMSIGDTQSAVINQSENQQNVLFKIREPKRHLQFIQPFRE
ncbi:hypothetical protein SDC9_98234 [bioreactor metagenome]|uniref:Uncharacterized protein n=1 Tax=bioreactor metagenome TaxID=1076179 RepID=A0A645AE59_9ZZZZ